MAKRTTGPAERIGGFRSTSVLGFSLLSIILAALGAFIWVANVDEDDKAYLTLAGEQRVLSQTIAKHALEAAAGGEQAFVQLAQTRERFAENLRILKEGDETIGLSAAGSGVQDPLLRVEKNWEELSQQADTILDAKGSILTIRELIALVTDFVPKLQETYGQVARLLVKKGSEPSQVYIATRQLMLAQRIEANANRVLAGRGESQAAARSFGRDAESFGRVLEGMLRGDPEIRVNRVEDPVAANKLREIAMMFSAVSDHAGKMIDLAPDIIPAEAAAENVVRISDSLNNASQALFEAFDEGLGRPTLWLRPVGPWLIIVLGVLALLVLIMFGGQMLLESRRREDISADQNQRNQQAILRLLDEMGDLADGDLTVQATVTEDITGAIADSINYTIEALRSLVTTINETSQKVSSSAQQTRATAMHLADASGHQAEQITTATAAIKQMAANISAVSKRALESAQVAQSSVKIASKGAETVRRNIEGMDTIREQIQETSKRIKRLGESSQEIGDIVELINDIADQTNILALNAAMQAAMAGEAGRGFAVVADEVQRLAERSSNATKQIEALVKTIQSDTNEAVSSMEQSTSGVVNGAKLAEEAGASLQEIETVSAQLAELIQGISRSALEQSDAAIRVSDTMNVIQEITNQTTDGTSQTAMSVGELAEMAAELRKSVAGFRLPVG
jgi:twitching motility protein PilJ